MKIIRDLPPCANNGEPVSIDLELTNMVSGRLHRPTGQFACASICMGRDPDTVYVVFDSDQLYTLMRRLEWGRQIYHNSLFDIRQLRRWAVVSPTVDVWDTMIVERDLWGAYYGDFGLNDLARRYLNIHMDKTIREQFENHEGAMTDEQVQYAAYDAWVTLQIYYEQVALKRDLRCYENIDKPAIFTFLDFKPVKVDVVAWRASLEGFAKEAKDREEKIGFNTMSPTQVKKAFLAVGVKLESTGEEVLALVDHPLAKEVLKIRSLRKNVSTYGESWLQENVEEGDLVYSNFQVTGAGTGRTSSSSPNLQNVPARKYPVYRTFFVPQNGVMTVADVSAQEPRILARLSGDKELTRIFREGLDPHATVAQRIFNDPTIKKGDFRRDRIGKKINLGTSYGLTAKGLMNGVNEEVEKSDWITLEQAEKFLADYFRGFPGVQNYITQTRIHAERRGYVETLSGRRIWVNPYSRGWQNECINAPIQGGAGDFSKLWSVKYWRACRKAGVEYPVCLFVHDELVSDHKPEEQEQYSKLLVDAFNETAQELIPEIPFEMSLDHGATWGCKH